MIATAPVSGSKLKIWCTPAMATTTALSLVDQTTSHGELSDTSSGCSLELAREAGGVLVHAGRARFQQPLDAVAGNRRGGSVRERQPAEAVVDGVGNHDVVARLRCHVLRKQHQALRFVEPGGG